MVFAMEIAHLALMNAELQMVIIFARTMLFAVISHALLGQIMYAHQRLTIAMKLQVVME